MKKKMGKKRRRRTEIKKEIKKSMSRDISPALYSATEENNAITSSQLFQDISGDFSIHFCHG